MSYCDFRHTLKGRMKCRRCGYIVPQHIAERAQGNIVRECRGPIRFPDVLSRLASFGKAVWRRVRRWGDNRTEAEVAAIFAICEECPHLTDRGCAKCGCRVSRESKWLNKLRWRSEHCPIGKW